MVHYNQNIPCPSCQTQIPFNSQELLRGTQFSCPTCHATIGLAAESRPVVQKAMEKFKEFKSDLSKQKQNKSML